MKVQNIKIEVIKPYEKNTKKHPETQIKNIAESIKQFGFIQPVVLDNNNEIIIGHGRYLASQLLGYEEIPCVFVDNLTEEQIRKLRILDNKLNESEWDDDLLRLELEDLDFGDFDVDFGLDFEEEQKEIVEDEVPEVDQEAEPICKLGDIWQLGRHRLMCGDSTKQEDVAKLMNGNKADMVFTDPPYGVSANGGRGDTKKKLKMKEIINDDKRGNDLFDFLKTHFSLMPTKAGASVYICYPWATQEEFTRAIKESGYNLQNCIIWRKNVFGLNGFKGYRPQYEMIYFCSKEDYQWYGDLAQSNVWDFNRSTEHTGNHPTPKPVELIAKAIKNSSKIEDTVFDGFGGSGSTLIACEQLDRKCYMVELSEAYCDVIIKRWEQFTGKKAVKIN